MGLTQGLCSRSCTTSCKHDAEGPLGIQTHFECSADQSAMQIVDASLRQAVVLSMTCYVEVT